MNKWYVIEEWIAAYDCCLFSISFDGSKAIWTASVGQLVGDGTWTREATGATADEAVINLKKLLGQLR